MDEFDDVRHKLNLATLLDVLTALLRADEIRAFQVVYQMYLKQGGVPLPLPDGVLHATPV